MDNEGTANADDLYRKDPVTGEFIKVERPAVSDDDHAVEHPPTGAVSRDAHLAERLAHYETASPRRRARPKRKWFRWSVLTALLIVVVLVGVGLAVGSSKSSQPSSAPAAVEAASQAPLACSHFALLAKPKRCLTPVVKARIREAKRAAAARAARARARQRAQAAAEAAAIRAANAWHAGYYGPVGDNLDVYYKWRSDLGCAEYALNGCWRIEAISENGCSYLSVTVNEMLGGAIVGNALANQVNVPPKTPVLLELDADTSESVKASAPTVQCTNFN